MIMNRTRTSLCAGLLLALTAGAATNGCADVQSDEQNVTDVQHTDVKKQAIGNCWVYAAAGWAESMHLRYTGNALNISESYISYWHWFEQLHGGAGGELQLAKIGDGELRTGGWWGVAAEIMLRYGMMDEGSFIPEEAEQARSSRQSSAKSAINASLKDGVLSDPEARRDPAIVRAELDKAWKLDEDVVALLDSTFGANVDRTLYGAARPADERIFLPIDVAVGHVDGASGRQLVTLADAIGEPYSSTDVKRRRGTYAWNRSYYPRDDAGRRDFQIELQRAMHAGQPVLLSWLVDFAAMKGSDFKAPPESPGRQGGHLIVVEDYQINNVPGHGTLEAGTLVTDPAVLEAALAPEAQIEFLRIKNSWGSSLAPDDSEALRGYHDLYMDYLDGPIEECQKEGDDKCASTEPATPLRKAILPSDGFLQAVNDTCDAASYQDTCSGDVLRWCGADGRLERFNCADGEWSCGFSDDLGAMDCVDPVTP
jgi:hypothetical protein